MLPVGWRQTCKRGKRPSSSVKYIMVRCILTFVELQVYDINRLRALGALINEQDPKAPKWSEEETANLLRGVLKYGEQNWRTILNEEQFEKSRAVNQLVLKWRMIKIFMKGELDSLNVKRQKLITKNDWIIAAIKGLEKKNNIHREPPTDNYQAYSSIHRLGDRISEDVCNSIDSSGAKGLRRSLSYNKPDTALLFPTKNASMGKLNYNFYYHYGRESKFQSCRRSPEERSRKVQRGQPSSA